MSTKITKVKTGESISPQKEEQSNSGTAQEKTPSTEDGFCGFDSLTLNKDQIKKQDALLRILDQLNASSSSENEELVKEGEKDSEEVEENGVDEDMTVDTGHVSETDSEQMEIDIENDKDTSVMSDGPPDRTKDSDVESVKSAADKLSVSDASENKVAETETKTAAKSPAPETTSKGESGAKVELCGTCDAEVNDAEEGICCDGDCERWFHLRCSGLTQLEYDELGLDENAKWACSRCSGKPPPNLTDPKPLLTVRKDLGQFSSPSPLLLLKKKSTPREGRSPKVDIANPAFLKPFDFGWKRELVYRSTNDNQNRRQGDVYYYTPKGKKLRSLREISDHLVGTDLTQDNFTFWKEPLGIDDSEKEIIRDAKYKLANKDPNASPVPVKKSLTPKTPKTPKVTPKLTATVTPLDTSGAPKVSASVTPRVVLKGKASPAAGPKFKVTPSKTATPGQAQKIVITKGGESIYNNHNIEDGNKPVSDVKADALLPNSGTEELIEMSTRNKFRRYGLLANAKTARKRGLRSAANGSSDGSSDSSPERAAITRVNQQSAKSTKKSDSKRNQRCNSSNDGSKVLKGSPVKKCAQNKDYTPSQSPSFTNQIPFSLSPDKYLSQNLLSRRPSPPEIQFRPSNPSSYGCQTSKPIMPRLTDSSTALYQSNMTNTRSVYETVLLVDTATPEAYIASQKPRDNPLILNNSDCSIEIVSVESLNSEGYAMPSFLNQSTAIKDANKVMAAMNKNVSPEFSRTSNEMNSPISLGSSSVEEIIIEDDDVDDRLPPFLQRTSPPPRARKNSSSPSRSPPNLQRIPSPPPLLFAGSISKPSSLACRYSKPPSLSVAPQNFDDSLVEDSSSNEPGSSQLNYRQLKKERVYMRQKSKREMMKLKKAYLKEKQSFTRKKYQEKALQVKYLSLKVKNKELKMALLQKTLENTGR